MMRFVLTNSKALQLFHLLRQSGTIVTAVLLTKSSLSLEDIGTYETLLFIGYVLSFWWVSGLVQGLLSRFPHLQPDEQRRLLFSAYVVFLGISVGLFAIAEAFQPQLLMLLTGKSEVPYFGIFMLFTLLNFPTFLLENLLLLQEKPRQILAFGGFSFLGQVTAVIAPVFLGWDFRWSFIGLVIFAAIKHLWLLANVWQHSTWQINWALLRDWIVLSTPLILYALLGGFNTAFDNWLVNHHFDGDKEVFAIFRYGAQELPLTLAITGAFGTAMLPEVAKNLPLSLSAIKSKSLRLFHILFPLSIVIVLTDRWLFPLVFNEVFIASVDIFNVYLLILISRLVFSRPILVGLQANKEVLYISLIELAVNIGASLLLVPSYGLVGIAFGTLIAFTLEKILLCAYLYWRFRVPVQAYTDLRWFALYSVMLVSAFLVAFCFL